MHPAFSVIFFTVSSGAGYGLLGLMAAYGLAQRLPLDPWFGWIGFILAFGLISVGLLSSLAHLGHPERFLRAFSQWRSSWLSREAVLSTGTYIPAGIFALYWLFIAIPARDATLWPLLPALLTTLAAAGCIATVICTAMIYGSLKPIAQWRSRWVIPNYLAHSLFTGALLLHALSTIFAPGTDATAALVVVGLAVSLVAKLAYWRAIDRMVSPSTPGTATGLGRFGEVRLLESPNTSENYLQQEMGYRIARKHARKLRAFVMIFAYGLPFLLTLVSLVTMLGAYGGIAAILAALSGLSGMLVERWLFFAQAKHTVMLYYGAKTA